MPIKYELGLSNHHMRKWARRALEDPSTLHEKSHYLLEKAADILMEEGPPALHCHFRVGYKGRVRVSIQENHNQLTWAHV
jgi:hypothetical protein